VQLKAVADAQAEAAQAGNRVAPSPCPLAVRRDATSPPPPLKQAGAGTTKNDAAHVCFLFPEPFNTTSPERQGAGLQHWEDVAVGAMDRAALLPLLQAVPLLVTTSSPPCPEREVSTEPFTLLWTRPSSRGWTEPCELAVCVSPAIPHRAAAQTRRRLRASHRAEPVVCRCRCLPQRARSLLCIVLMLSRRAHAEFRLAVGTHTLSTPPSSEGPAVLGPRVG
jgi:hypothetical protein